MTFYTSTPQTLWSCTTSIPVATRRQFLWWRRASLGGRTSTWSSGTPPAAQTSPWFSKVIRANCAAASQLTRQQFLHSDQHVLCFFFSVPLFRHQQAGELEEASVRAGRVGSRQQRFHQRGPDRVDANGRPADLSQAVPHHPEEAQHGADAAQRQLHPERHIQYPLARGHKLKPSSLLCLLRSCTMRAAADVCLFLM